MRLAEQPDIPVSALAAPCPVSLPAIMKHLDVLADAGLVARSKTGRVVACRLDTPSRCKTRSSNRSPD
jgi:DNA-binding transcriptional ArsR family regulator